MKKLFALAIIVTLFAFGACKKEEPKTETPPASGKPAGQSEFKPAKPHKKNAKGENAPAVASDLKIYQESQLLTTVPQSQFPAVTTAKVKIGNKQMPAVLLKDLLAKYNVKSAKNVTLKGQTVSATLTWAQANANDLYVYLTPKNFLKVQAATATMASVKFPKRVESITVSASEMAAKPPANPPKPEK